MKRKTGSINRYRLTYKYKSGGVSPCFMLSRYTSLTLLGHIIDGVIVLLTWRVT